uniref:NADH dehydrogenase subunit 6 n=1 Tax=Perinereis camiguinoides TaxID=1456959 RepID=UPI0021145E27|nr:NADH dehydrogenase subunit 6 [Perinereis camiguinoides]USR67342.1 NADH dehydrogenase subunit 6 [Perinereis camiguinoides]
MINSIIVTLFISCLSAMSPINLGVLVLLVALSVAAALSLMSTGWFGLITFIIYVGGMLVMFAYFAALQPNQFITSWSWVLIPSFLISVIFIMWSFSTMNWLPHSPNISQIYSITNLILPILMALILFLALIMVVKTSRADEGPLRPFMYV